MARNFVRLLLLVFAISASAWTFNAELMAEVLAEAQGEISLEMGHTDADGHPIKAQDSCNHGCHVVNHLQGQSSTYFLTANTHTDIRFQQVTASFSLQLSASPFRPPRLLFLI